MTYQATVFQVMIASPSDVAKERQLVREIVLEWNAVHAADRSIVLLPVGWDTHASPAMGERPQEVINKQILRGADLLIAIFWARLGSPTGTSQSGTVEEIEEHLQAGKPAMLYFSNVPVRLDSVDDTQYAALREFKERCLERGLCESFDSPAELQAKLTRQLAQTVIRDLGVRAARTGEPLSPTRRPADEPARSGNGSEVATPPLTVPSQGAPTYRMAPVTPQARTLLLEGVKDPQGGITRLEHASGVSFAANGKELFEGYGGREHAEWEHALGMLVEMGLVKGDPHGSPFYRITANGYSTADALSK